MEAGRPVFTKASSTLADGKQVLTVTVRHEVKVLPNSNWASAY